jgi:hypothetical protein
MVSHEFITVFNRTDIPLRVTKNGHTYIIPPGQSPLRADLVRFAREQNPVPGTDDGNYNGFFETLISIVAKEGQTQRDPLVEIPSAVLGSLSKERIDRSQLPLDRQQRVRHVEFAGLRRAQVSLQNPTEGFVDGSIMQGPQ